MQKKSLHAEVINLNSDEDCHCGKTSGVKIVKPENLEIPEVDEDLLQKRKDLWNF